MIRQPKISISDVFAVNDLGEYRVKIVNYSRFSLSNVSIKLQKVTQSIGTNGELRNTVNIPIENSIIDYIEKYSKRDECAKYAIRVGLVRDIESIWQEDQHTYLQLIVTCSDKTGNSKKVFIKKYHKKSLCIVKGEFRSGKSLDVARDE